MTGGAPPPAGFDTRLLQATSRGLMCKRAREAAKAWPTLCQDLGAAYLPQFLAYAARVPAPAAGGPLVDALQFVMSARAGHELSARARLELACGRAHWSMRRGRIHARRFGIALAVLGRPSRIVLAVRLPILGFRQIRLGR